MHDTDLYVNVTVGDIKNVFYNTVGVFNHEIDKIDENFNIFIGEIMGDIKIDSMNNSVNEMLGLFDDYAIIENHLDLVSQTQTNITIIASDITTQCSNGGPISECTDIDSIVSDLGAVSLPSLPKLDQSLEDQLKEVSDIFNSIPEEIKSLNISAILSELKDQVNSITDDFDDALDPIYDIQFRNISTTKISDFIEDYTKWVNVGFLSVGGVLIFIITLVVLSIFCGACNKHGRSSCGSRTLCCSLSIFFAAAIFLFILCAALFTVGAMSQKIVCDSLDKPEDSEIIRFIDPFFNNIINDIFNATSIILGEDASEEIIFNISIPELISGIHRGDPIYPLLQLNNVFDINELENWQEDFGIENIIRSMWDDINGAITDITSIKDDIPEYEIKNIVKVFDDSINTVLQDILNEDNINKLIQEQVKKINDIIVQLESLNQPSLDDLIKMIKDLKIEVQKLLENIVLVQEDLHDVLRKFGNETTNQMNLSGFTSDVFGLVDDAFVIIPSKITNFVNGTIEGLLTAVDNQIPIVVDAINNEIGATTPLGNIYDATYTNICLELVSPLNSSMKKT